MSLRDRMKPKIIVGPGKIYNWLPQDPFGDRATVYKEDDPRGRHYRTEGGHVYPSITTVLSILSKESIAKWKAWMGEAEANRVSTKAKNRGTELHLLCEQYVKNQAPTTYPNLMLKFMFERIIPILNNIDNIQAQETALYSDNLRVAGRVDLIADYLNIPSVIDFKGADKEKEIKEVYSYFLQVTAYSIMFEELTGRSIKNLVIIISNETGMPQVFTVNRDDYIDGLKETINLYYKENS